MVNRATAWVATAICVALATPVLAGAEGRRPSPAQIFQWLDKDHDGTLTRQEYIENSRFKNKEQARKIFEAADTDGDGAITQERYVEHRRITDKAKEIFGKLDGNGDGKMTEAEFVAKAGAIFQALDGDADGAVTIPEYLRARMEWAAMAGPSVEELLKRLAAARQTEEGGRRQPDRPKGGARGPGAP